jgi:hypothetical protein
MIEAMGLKISHEVLFNGINSMPNFMKIYQALPKLLVGDCARTDQVRTQDEAFLEYSIWYEHISIS